MVVSVQFLWFVQNSIQWWEEPFEPSIHVFFYILDDAAAAAAYNLKKMTINSVFILCTDVSHFC